MAPEKKKVQKYCRIFNWIQDNDEEFADVMINLCLDRIADINRRNQSITFLMPRGKLRTDIIDMAYSTVPEKAVDIIISLVIPVGIDSIETFNNMKPEHIGNKLRYIFPKIVNPNSKTVNFDNKLVIKQWQPKFVPRDNTKIYVYEIESGIPPGNIEKLNKYVDKQEFVISDNTKQVKGAAEECHQDPISQLNGKPRAMFAQTIEQFVRDEIQKIHNKNIYLPVTVLLLQKLLEPSHYHTFIKIKPILDVDPIITFYLILEPYKLSGEFLVSNDIFNNRLFENILKIRTSIEDPVSIYRSIINKIIDEPAMVFHETRLIIDNINILRNKLLNDTEARILPEEIISIYNTIEEKNEIKVIGNKAVNLTNVFPESLISHYRNNHNKRLWQDEYRFIIGECLRTMKTEPDASARLVVFNNICNTLKLNLRGDDYSTELCIMNYAEYPLTSCVRDRVRMMQYFVNSPDFLYIGCNMELICGISSPNNTEHGTQRLIMTDKALDKHTADKFDVDGFISGLTPTLRNKILADLKKTNDENKDILDNSSDDDK